MEDGEHFLKKTSTTTDVQTWIMMSKHEEIHTCFLSYLDMPTDITKSVSITSNDV
jgi:hypothetical protein